MLCKSCVGQCRELASEAEPLEIACTACEETGQDRNGEPCEHCSDGFWPLLQCPKSYIGQEMVGAINLAVMCKDGLMPVAGGILDQSAWFVELLTSLNNEQNRIDIERAQEA